MSLLHVVVCAWGCNNRDVVLLAGSPHTLRCGCPVEWWLRVLHRLGSLLGSRPWSNPQVDPAPH